MNHTILFASLFLVTAACAVPASEQEGDSYSRSDIKSGGDVPCRKDFLSHQSNTKFSPSLCPESSTYCRVVTGGELYACESDEPLPTAERDEDATSTTVTTTPKKDAIASVENDCYAGGDADCAGMPTSVGEDGAELTPECFYLAKRKVYQCATYPEVKSQGAIEAPGGGLNGKIPGSGAICFHNESTACSRFDSRLHCTMDPAVEAQFPGGYGTCYARAR